MTNKTTNKFSPEVRIRAVRMVLDHESEHRSRWAADTSIADKIGCVPQTLNEWIDDSNVHLDAQNLPAKDVSLKFENYKSFFEKRRANLKKRLLGRVFMSKSIAEVPSSQDFDDEVVEEPVI